VYVIFEVTTLGNIKLYLIKINNFNQNNCIIIGLRVGTINSLIFSQEQNDFRNNVLNISTKVSTFTTVLSGNIPFKGIFTEGVQHL
jgi:hypothetical protein